MKNQKLRITMSQKLSLTGLLFVAPWLVGFVIFFLSPLAQAIAFSMNKVTITAAGLKMDYVGAGNYADIFIRDAYYVDRLLNFIKELVLQLPLILVFSLVIAILINQRIKGQGIFRTIFFLPIIAVSGPVMEMLTTSGATTIPLVKQYGLNDIITSMLPHFLQEPVISLFSELLLILWYSGVPTLMFLAGLQKVDRTLFEAAFVDGASDWVAFWKITLPSIKGMILVNSIYVTVFLATAETNEVISLIQDNMSWIYSLCIVLIIVVCYLLFGREGKAARNRHY